MDEKIKITVKGFDKKTKIEINDDMDIDGLFGVFNTIAISLGYTQDTFENGIITYTQEYNLLKKRK
jgi:hypothetical protein